MRPSSYKLRLFYEEASDKKISVQRRRLYKKEVNDKKIQKRLVENFVLYSILKHETKTALQRSEQQEN